MGDKHMSLQALIMGQAMRKLKPLAAKKRCHIMVINQIRSKMGVVFGNATTTPGGSATKFAASIRLQLFGGKTLKNAVGQHVGKTVTFLAVKNRFAPPYRKARVRLIYNRGWDNYWSTVDHAKSLQVIPKGLKVDEAHARAVAWFRAHDWVTGGGVPEDPLEALDALDDVAEEDGLDGEDDDS
jgi:recombination protein RecA